MATLHVATDDRLVTATGGPDGWRTVERLREHRLEAVAATTDTTLVGTFGAGLYRGTDDGTFERVGEGVLPDAVLSLAVSPHDPAVVWAGTEPSRVFRSADGGRTWTERTGLTDLPSADRWSFPPRPHTHHARWLEPDPHDPGRLYVGIEAGAFVRLDEDGERGDWTWTDHPAGARRDNHTLDTHPDAPGVVYTAAGDGFAVSRDGGASWAYPQDGLAHRYCWSVVAAPADPDRLVLSAASGPHTAHSTDGAESYVYRRAGDGPWERVESGALPTGEGVTRTVLTRDEEAVYAANNRGLFRSVDAGATWEALGVQWPDRVTGGTVRGLAVV